MRPISTIEYSPHFLRSFKQISRTLFSEIQEGEMIFRFTSHDSVQFIDVGGHSIYH